MKVAVIGAGAGGLVCARELLTAGHTPTVFEASDHIGGTWAYGPDEDQHSVMYASLRTNLPKDVMAFRDAAFGDEDDARRFPGHAAVLSYLRRFSDAFGIGEHLRLGQQVHRLERQTSGFLLHVDRPRRFDAVAICTGHFRRPSIPNLPGQGGFTGEVMHSGTYRVPDPFMGKRVALLGAKSSGIDISAELAALASRVWLCGRDLEPASAPKGVCARASVVGCDGAALLLEDGSRLEDVDVLMLCTGYDYSVPFLEPGASYVTVESKWIHPLWLDVVCVREPKLAFIGLPFQVVPFPMMELQSRLFAQLLSGRLAPPTASQMQLKHDAAVQRLDAAGVAPRHRFRYGPRQFAAIDDLAARVGSALLPAWFRPLYEATGAARKADPTGYRDRPELLLGPR